MSIPVLRLALTGGFAVALIAATVLLIIDSFKGREQGHEQQPLNEFKNIPPEASTEELEERKKRDLEKGSKVFATGRAEVDANGLRQRQIKSNTQDDDRKCYLSETTQKRENLPLVIPSSSSSNVLRPSLLDDDEEDHATQLSYISALEQENERRRQALQEEEKQLAELERQLQTRKAELDAELADFEFRSTMLGSASLTLLAMHEPVDASGEEFRIPFTPTASPIPADVASPIAKTTSEKDKANVFEAAMESDYENLSEANYQWKMEEEDTGMFHDSGSEMHGVKSVESDAWTEVDETQSEF